MQFKNIINLQCQKNSPIALIHISEVNYNQGYILKTKDKKITPFNWRYKLLRKSKTPTNSKDCLRICWYFDEESKHSVYEYRDEVGNTTCFAINALQAELPSFMSKKYFYPNERALLFGYFFDEIKIFINKNVGDEDFFNFCGVTKKVFFSLDSHNALLECCENQT